MYVCGIDIGKKGGLCVINQQENTIETLTNPDMYIYNYVLSKFKPKCIIEKVHSIRGQGLKSTFNFGVEKGKILSLFEINDLKYIEVSPKRIFNYFNLSRDKKEHCKVAMEIYKERFKTTIGGNTIVPEDIFMTSRGALLDGLCDAFLITVFALDNKIF